MQSWRRVTGDGGRRPRSYGGQGRRCQAERLCHLPQAQALLGPEVAELAPQAATSGEEGLADLVPTVG